MTGDTFEVVPNTSKSTEIRTGAKNCCPDRLMSTRPFLFPVSRSSDEVVQASHVSALGSETQVSVFRTESDNEASWRQRSVTAPAAHGVPETTNVKQLDGTATSEFALEVIRGESRVVSFGQPTSLGTGNGNRGVMTPRRDICTTRLS